MDSQTPSPKHEPNHSHDLDHNQIDINGSCPESPNNTHQRNSIPKSSPPDSKSSPATVGAGLRRWKRIPRERAKEATSAAATDDSGRAHKRVLPANADPTTAKARDPTFSASSAVAADSESSKSSTAASAPKPRLDKITKVKVNNSLPAKSKAVESSKKARGDRLRIHKENSQSSVESESMSSNVFSVAAQNSTPNGKQLSTARSASYDGENNDDADASDHAQTGYDDDNKENLDDSHDSSAAEVSWGLKEPKSETNKFSATRDPLVESIFNLQSVQEALLKEVEKLGEIGKEPILSLEKLMENGSVEANKAAKQSGSGESSLQDKVSSLQQNVELLERKLEEATTLLVEKESKISHLEANSKKPPEEESDYVYIERVFKQRIEAEIEYFVITNATESLKMVAGKQVTLLKELESVAEGQEEMLNKLGETETKAAKLKKEAQELEKYRSDILETEEVLVTQRKVYKFTWCFFTQLILFMLVLCIFVSQRSSNPGAVVPT